MNLNDSDCKSLDLGSPQLQRLSCRSKKINYWRDNVRGRLRKLTGLTQVQLSGFSDLRCFKQLFSAQLQEAIFTNCEDLHVLKTEQPMRSLERLHIEDDRSLEYPYHEVERERLDKQAKEIMPELLSLPNLRQLSGSSRFFEIGMTLGLELWDTCKHTQLKTSEYGDAYFREVRKWTRK